MLLHSSEAHKRVLVDQSQDTVFSWIFELQVVAIVYLEGFLLDDHLLDDVRLAFDVASPEEQEVVLALEGQQRGGGGGVGCEGSVVAAVLKFHPSLVVVVESLSWSIGDPLVARQPSKHVNIVLKNSCSCFGSFYIQVPKLEPLPLFNAIHLSLFDESFLLRVSAYREHHLPVFVVDKAMTRTRSEHRRYLNDLEVLVVAGDRDDETIVGGSHLVD